jgi:hypothetical protein
MGTASDVLLDILEDFEEFTGCPTITKQSTDKIPRAHIKSKSSSHHLSTL